MDHSWIDRGVIDGMIYAEYREGVEYFYDFTFRNAVFLHQGWACCPCNRYGNRKIFDKDIITIYLYKSRFMPNYKHGYLHGKMWEKVPRVRSELVPNTDKMVDMVVDAADPEFNGNMEDDLEIDSSDFYYILKDADKLLWLGCDTNTVSSIMLELLNLKAKFNMIVNCYDMMIAIIKKMLLKGEKLVESFYTLKKMMKWLDMEYKMIDAYHIDYILFYKKDQLMSHITYTMKANLSRDKRIGIRRT